ncbi:MAG: response regulator [Candidatus Magnetomorum sp.]|nr:response regulator [Candidatus Magnetomorum sp.]
MTVNNRQSNTILVVDDNDSNIDILVEALGEEFDISVALDGETALEDIDANPPSLILLDIMMPGITGLEVCKRLKSNDRLSKIPIIFLTAMGDLDSKTLGFELGAVDYITKPFQLPELKARVRTHLELKNYRDHMESLVKQRTSELEKANENLKELLKNERQLTIDAKASGEAKSNFINIVSHELRTPLNAIMGMNEMLFTTKLTSEQDEYVNIVKESSQNLLGIINDILDFSDIDTGKMNLEKSDFRMDEVIRDIADMIANKDATFMIDIAPDTPNQLIGDPLRLKKVLANLIDNALKFSTNRAEITLGLKTSYPKWNPLKTTCSFYVKDRGIGLTSENIDLLFKEPFTQVESSYCRSYGGMGLGLSICKSLVAMMGGELQVESEPGQGSIFSFTAQFERRIQGAPPFEFPSGVINLKMIQ